MGIQVSFDNPLANYREYTIHILLFVQIVSYIVGILAMPKSIL